MKYLTIFLPFLLSMIYTSTHAQRTILNRTKINIEALQFKGVGSSYFKVGDSSTKMEMVLGSYDSQEDFYHEMDEMMAQLFKYGNSKFYYYSDKLNSWEIADNEIYLGRNGHYFTVGDAIEEVYAAFPEYEDHTANNGELYIALRSVNYDMECTNVIVYFENGLITMIRKHTC